MKVVTKPGGHVHTVQDTKKPQTEEQFAAICKQANKQAEELGIKTRYEVVA